MKINLTFIFISQLSVGNALSNLKQMSSNPNRKFYLIPDETALKVYMAESSSFIYSFSVLETTLILTAKYNLVTDTSAQAVNISCRLKAGLNILTLNDYYILLKRSKGKLYPRDLSTEIYRQKSL